MMPVLHALRAGLTVSSATVQYTAPAAMKEQEERSLTFIRKRLMQVGAVHCWCIVGALLVRSCRSVCVWGCIGAVLGWCCGDVLWCCGAAVVVGALVVFCAL